MNIKFRPHHFLCTLGYKGKGYSKAFTDNFTNIKNFLEENPDHLIEVTEKTDSICSHCPSQRGELCETQSKIETIDKNHQLILDIKENDRLSWKDAKKLIKEKFNSENMNKACDLCSWRTLGICEAELLKLKKTILILLISLLTTTSSFASAYSLKTLQKGWSEYQKNNFKKSIQTLSQMKDSHYRDHQLALLGFAYKAQGDLLFQSSKNQFLKTEKSYVHAKNSFLKIRKLFPNSSWNQYRKSNIYRTNLTQEVSLIELKLLELYSKNNKNFIAIKNAHSAFQKLYAQYNLIKFNQLEAYSKSCKITGIEICSEWIKNLMSFYEKDSEERNYLVKEFPAFSSTPSDYWKEKSDLPKPLELPPSDSPTDLISKELRKAILTNDSKKILEQCENFKKLNLPKSHELWSRTQYWEGTIKKDPNLLKEIIDHNPLDYYSILASHELNINLFSSFEKSSSVPNINAKKRLFFYNRAIKLLKYDLKFLSSIDLLSYSPSELKNNQTSAQTLLKLARLYSKAGLQHFALSNFISPLIEKESKLFLNLEDLKIYFPLEFFDLITIKSKQINIDPILMQSLIRRESLFEPSILSNVGAMGLTQLMYYTARSLRKSDESINRIELLGIENNPEKNIELGSIYLKSLILKNGNIAQSLASYNAGPTAVSYWIKPSLTSSGEVPKPLKFCNKDEIKDNKCLVVRTDELKTFIETIPYTETRKYVSNIFRNYFFYKKLIENKEIPVPLQWTP